MEVWKDCYGCFQISTMGRIRNAQTGTILQQQENKKGYAEVHIVSATSKKIRIHRAVAEAFIPNPENKPQVNHKNGNKKDNRVENLEWCTAEENVQHALKSGLRPTRQVAQYSRQGALLKEWSSIKEAGEALHTSCSTIVQCCKGRLKTAGGFVWRYKEADA